MILNGLQTSVDTIFCDVLDYSNDHKASELSTKIEKLPPDEQKRILGMVELMIRQTTENNT